MKEQVNFNSFCDRFRTFNRNNNFSYEGKRALFDYLEQYEQELNIEIEFDCIGLCCEYTEYKSLTEFQKDYSKDYETIEDIMDVTEVIIIDSGGFIVRQF